MEELAQIPSGRAAASESRLALPAGRACSLGLAGVPVAFALDETRAGMGTRTNRLTWVHGSTTLQERRRSVPEPPLVPPGVDGIAAAAAEAAGLIVAGLSDRWRQEGLGEARREVARRARPPTLLVRRGLRPGGIASQKTLTRFTQSLARS